MSKKIFGHMGYKIISLCLAIFIWFVVANVDDYKTIKTISGVEIEFANEEAITDNNKVFDVPAGTTINIVVKGRRSIVEKLGPDDFTAVADLSKLSITNSVNVVVSADNKLYNSELSINYPETAIHVEVEDKIEKQLPVVVRADAEVKEGYAVCGKVAMPNLVTLKGPKSIVDRIQSVAVDVDVKGASQTINTSGNPIFLDGNGDVIDSNKVECEIQNIDVSVVIKKTKVIKVKIETEGSLAPGYMISSIDYQPSEITIVGNSKELAEIDELVIDDLSVADLSEDLETSVLIVDYLPPEVTLVGTESEIMVKIGVEQRKEKTFRVNPSDIALIGKKSQCNYEIDDEKSCIIKVSGLKSDLDRLELKDILNGVDVKNYSNGNYYITLSVGEREGITVESVPTIHLTVSSK